MERYTSVRMRYAIVGTIAAILALSAAPVQADDDLMKRVLMDFKPIPSVVPAVKDNAVTHEKAGLGKLLFFDPRLSASEIISCNTCHNLGTGGVDAGPTSVGHGWQKGPRRAPTVYNAVFNVAQFWDGRAADLKAQAKGPVQASVEMNATPDHVVKTLSSMPEYVDLFKKAFPNEASPVTFDNFAKAIEAFEATLITPGSKFDQFLEGDANALNAQEKAGLTLFLDKGCAGCHNGINVGGQDYFPFGIVENSWRRRAARGGQGPLRGDEDSERRICVPRRAAAQRRAAGAVFPFGAGVEPQASGRRDGRLAALGQADRQGRRRHRRLPRHVDRATAEDRISGPPGAHHRDAGAVAGSVK